MLITEDIIRKALEGQKIVCNKLEGREKIGFQYITSNLNLIRGEKT